MFVCLGVRRLRTTSAYAEKRVWLVAIEFQQWNYLRIRGEEAVTVISLLRRRELPPHTRRRAMISPICTSGGGTTSAYAEKRLDLRQKGI